MKHTPGPWKAVGTFIGTVESDSQTIAYVDNHRNRKLRAEGEDEANARLIAAAPELLEHGYALAIQAFENKHDVYSRYNYDSNYRDSVNAIIALYKMIEGI